MDMLNAELTYLDAEIQRINHEINDTIQDVVNSTPRINAPGVRVRHRRGQVLIQLVVRVMCTSHSQRQFVYPDREVV